MKFLPVGPIDLIVNKQTIKSGLSRQALRARTKSQFLFALVFSFLFCLPPAYPEGKPFDHSELHQVLSQYVNEAGAVDYEGIKKNPTSLDLYLSQLDLIDPLTISSWPREEVLALWLNAFHAGVIKMIVDHYPVKTIQDIPSVWDQTFVRIGGLSYALNAIRQGSLIGTFRDEKIHTALACSAKSCPRMPQEAYTGPRVEGQLFLATRNFVNQKDYVDINPAKKSVHVSKIFYWYGKDFQLDFGTVENQKNFSPEEYAVLSFISHYLEDVDAVRFLEEGEYKVKYLPFDWSLNEWKHDAETQTAAA